MVKIKGSIVKRELLVGNIQRIREILNAIPMTQNQRYDLDSEIDLLFGDAMKENKKFE